MSLPVPPAITVTGSTANGHRPTMQITAFLPANTAIAPPLSLASKVQIQPPARPPGFDLFPLLEGVTLLAAPGTAIQVVAAGDVLAVDPLVIGHANNVTSKYHWVGIPTVMPGQQLVAGDCLGHLPNAPDEPALRFEIGLSLVAGGYNARDFMRFDPRPLLAGHALAEMPTPGQLWQGNVPLDGVPLFLQAAIVAAEDRRFYQHFGLDLASIARVLLTNLRQRRIVAGASTITQQAARSALRITRRSWARKLAEMPIAIVLEWFHDKDAILELYFNSIYWGRGATNVAAAAVAFFGKNVWALNFKECLILAALPNHPLHWQLTAAELALLERKAETVLRLMCEQQLIDDTIASLAASQPYRLIRH